MSLSSKQTRATSTVSTFFSTHNESYEDVNVNELYNDILKVVILEYRTEARFRTPIIKRPLSTLNGVNTSASATTSISKNKSSDKLSEKTFGKFRSHYANKADLPSHTLASLETRLNYIAMNQTKLNMDKNTVRSLLRLYSELLDPNTKKEYTRIKQPEALVVKFISCANKELTKVTSDANDMSISVFQQTTAFVDILINIIKSDKNSSEIIDRLEEYKQSLKPAKLSTSKSNSLTPSSSILSTQEVKYPSPSFRLSEMEAAQFVGKLFNVDEVKLQQDIFKLKDVSTEESLIKDMLEIKALLGKELGNFTKNDFSEREFYIYWKQREMEGCDQVIKRYQPPANMKTVEPPKLKSGEMFYMIPHNARAEMIILQKMCLSQDSQATHTQNLLSKSSIDIINSCCRIWRIDFPSRAVGFYTAANLSILKELDIERLGIVFQMCKRIVTEQGKLNWNQKSMWSTLDNDEWVYNLSNSYSQALSGIRETLGSIFNSTKPRFKPYLQLLEEYIEADASFESIEASGLPKKWEKKLYKSLLRVAEVRYADLLQNLPRDNTLDIVHILNISDSIVADIKMLQKRYTSPLLGFLNIPRTCAAVITGMFSADSGNILKHIQAYAKRQNTTLDFSEAMDAYKSLFEIRNIHEQVASKGSIFQFKLEKFFYPYIEEWAEESGKRILSFVDEAVNQDKFESIDEENDDQKHSVSVVDIFKMINELFKILRDLNWQDELQVAKLYTVLLKNVSDGIVNYANRITDHLIKDLAETIEESADTSDRKSGSKWFDGVKAAVTGSNKLEWEEPYAFLPRTCIALNNLSAMLKRLDSLEDLIDPESVSKTIERYEPKSKNAYTSHLFSLRIVKAENLKPSANGSIRPYITLIDAKAKRRIGKTRTIDNNANPEWDEEFELTLPGNSSLTISTTVWDEKFGTHAICGRAILQLDPKRFNNDGIAQDIYLDLDPQGRVLVEVAMESERVDAIFCLGRAHRCLKRCQERAIKLIVEKFSRFIYMAFSRSTLKSICGSNGLLKPQKDMIDEAIAPLYDYLNSNLQILAQYLTTELLLNVMLAAWSVVVSSADSLLLPKLASAKTFNLSNLGSKLTAQTSNGWQSAVSSAVANVTGSGGIAGYGRPLTSQELDTVFSWLNYLCFDFFHHDGNGPPLRDLKNEQYQALLLVPVFYDRDVLFLEQEVERLSPAFVKSLRDKHNFEDNSTGSSVSINEPGISRAGTLVRNKTIMANGTVKARAKAAKEAEEAMKDPTTAQAAAEDIILRLLLIKDDRSYVAKRLEQREKLVHSVATERLARAAVEGRF